MYMDAIGVAELRQNLSVYLRRVEQGERLTVTDHNRPVAELVPITQGLTPLDRLIAEGKATAPRRRHRFNPLVMGSRRNAASEALYELRGDD